MPYTPVTFTDGVTNLNKTNLDQLQGGVIAAERTEYKGVANGYASLDSGGKITAAQLPTSVGSIPGSMLMWPCSNLPAASFGKWVWADGASYAVATYPIAAGNIDAIWKTFGGLADPGAGNFRVPDMRGLYPVGMDAMPGGSRVNRITRSGANVLAGRTGEEYHTLSAAEMPVHAHTASSGTESADHTHTVNSHAHGGGNHTHTLRGGDRQSGSYAQVPIGLDYNYMESTADGGSLTYSGSIVAAEAPGTGGRSAAHTHAITVNNAGSGSTHENMPPTVFIPFIVRLDG